MAAVKIRCGMSFQENEQMKHLYIDYRHICFRWELKLISSCLYKQLTRVDDEGTERKNEKKPIVSEFSLTGTVGH